MNSWKIGWLLQILIISNSVSAVTLHSSDWEPSSSLTYSVRFGNPEIVSSTDIFNSSSLAFNTTGNAPSFYYDQIQYDIVSENSPYKSFNLSFDIYTESLIGSNNDFSVLFDTPGVRNFVFTNGGNIEVKPGYGSTRVLSTYGENQSMRIDMNFDIANNLWKVSLDNVNIYSGIIDNTSNPYLRPAEYLRAIRFSHGLESAADSPSHGSTVYLDNVTISAVPIPASIWLFVSGALCLFRLARPAD